MEGRTLEQFRGERRTWDRHVMCTEGIDHWCSRSLWILGVHTAFSPEERADDVLIGVAEAGAVTFARRRLEDGSAALLPFDATWAFGAAIVSSATGDASGGGRALAEFCRDAAAWLIADPSWRLLACSGLRAGSPLDQAVIAAFAPHARVLAGPDTERCVADLVEGLDAWESRRTRSFRRNIRQAQARAADHGVSIEIADDQSPTTVLERLHGVERSSWKGLEGSGIESDEMSDLYAGLVADLSAMGGLRCAFARVEGRDVGFILGGVLGDTYRGLQISFVEDVRALSIGNVLQAHEIARLCVAGVPRYDLGMDIPYKRNWGEQLVTTRTLLIVR